MSTISNEEAQAALKVILKKASTDADFRAKLVSDPNAAVKEATGKDVPAGLELKFVEGGTATVIVLPPLSSESEALDDSELEAVAGGLPPHSGGCHSKTLLYC